MEQGLQHPGGWLLEAMEGVLRTSSNSGEVALALTGGRSPDFKIKASPSTPSYQTQLFTPTMTRVTPY